MPTAKTTLTEAPETAAEAEAAQQEEFPIYSQDSNYDETYDYSQEDSSYDDSYDSSGGDSSGSDQITYPTEDSGDSSGSDTSDIPDYTEDTSDDSGQDNNENWDYIIMEMVLVPIAKETIRRIPPIRILNTMNKKRILPGRAWKFQRNFLLHNKNPRISGDFIII